MGEILLLRSWLADCYSGILTCACNTAFVGCRGGLAVLQTYQLLCGLLLNQMLRANSNLVMVKSEEKHVGFLSPWEEEAQGDEMLAPTLPMHGTHGVCGRLLCRKVPSSWL